MNSKFYEKTGTHSFFINGNGHDTPLFYFRGTITAHITTNTYFFQQKKYQEVWNFTLVTCWWLVEIRLNQKGQQHVQVED